MEINDKQDVFVFLCEFEIIYNINVEAIISKKSIFPIYIFQALVSQSPILKNGRLLQVALVRCTRLVAYAA